MTALDEAVRVLRAGGLVAFPTETVYGLGADASNPEAVKGIFAAKGRPAGHPLIVHLASEDQLSSWARDTPPSALQLARAFWPGPMTLILKRAQGVIDEVTGGQNSVGLRIPSHPMARDLLAAFGGGVAAPSANRFGRISPTTAEHVRTELGDRVDLILDGGACDVGIESTIVDLSSGVPVLLRPGHISIRQLESVLGQPVGRASQASPRASGTLEAHYAPSKPLLLVEPARLKATIAEQSRAGVVAVLSPQSPFTDVVVAIWRQAPASSEDYAHDLYAALRELDASACTTIIVEAPPESGQWMAVRDRLQRSAAGSQTHAT